jgi:hypothetical protein
MFKQFLFAIVVSTVSLSSTAKADYTCNDRQYLRSILIQLDASCGGQGNQVCTATNNWGTTYRGSTIDTAIASCIADGNSRSACNSGAACPSGVQVCTATNSWGTTYKGSTIDTAISSCVADGNSRSACNSGAACPSGVQVCTATNSWGTKYRGNTIDSAIASCIADGNSQSACHSQARCN